MGLRAAQIRRSVDVEKPVCCGQVLRMINLAGLDEKLHRKHADRLTQAGRGSLERRETSPASGLQLAFQSGQRGAVQHHRKGLRKAVHRGNGDGAAGNSRAMKEMNDERRRKQRLIDGYEDGPRGGCGSEGRAYAAQWTQAGLGVGDDRRKIVKSGGGTGDAWCEAGTAQDFERVSQQRPAGKLDQCLVAAHAT